MGRTPCCDKNGLKKGPWTPEEDQKLTDYITVHGSRNWRTLPQNAGLQRCGKSCRLRWTNYLRPDIKRGRFSPEEEETIIQLHSMLGNKWSAIAVRLPGRTDNEIKNYWNTHIRKKLLRMGIDPVTHSPRLDLLNLSLILRTYLHSDSSPMNTYKLSGIQSYVNPEILKIASSLLSQQPVNQNYSHQNGQENQLHEPLAQNIVPQRVQEVPDLISNYFGQLSDGAEVMVSSTESSFSGNDVVLCPQNSPRASYDWGRYRILQPNSSDQHYDLVGNYDGWEANAMDSQYDILSFCSASPTPLHSNSTYVDSSFTTAADDIWKINDFM